MKTKWLILALCSGMFCTANHVSAQKIDLNKAGKTVKNAADNKKEKKETESKGTSSSSTSAAPSTSTQSSNKTESMIGTPQQKRQEALGEEAVVLMEEGKMEAGMAKLQEAHDACPTCPDAAEIRKILGIQPQLSQMEDAKYTCKDIKSDNGISSTTHTQYVKKIVFSKSEIVKGQENSASFTNSFTLADNIYSRIYVEKAPGFEAKNMGVCYNTPVYLRYTINDGKTTFPVDAGGNFGRANGDDTFFDKSTTWQMAMSPASANEGFPKSELQDFYDKMFSLPEGNHKIKIELVLDIPDDKIGPSDLDSYMYTTKFGPEKLLAVGEFNITIKNADKATMKKKLGVMSKEEKEAASKAAYEAAMKNRSTSSSSSSSMNTNVTVKNTGSQPVYIAKYNSESSNSSVSSGEALYSGSSMTIDGSFYPKITVTGGCTGTYILKDKGGQTIEICK